MRRAESLTLVSLMLHALKHVPIEEIFDRDPYESRRTALKGETLVPVLVAYQMLRQPGIRGLIRATQAPTPLPEALGGPGARNPLATALTQRPGEQREEAGLSVRQR